ncbi:MAG: acetolactate synthase small subunit, partial [Eubacterium sp.]|nr:acetolactate synthase small subunit [Candidatus Colimonas fimequi]
LKVKCDKTERSSIKEIVDIYRGKIIDLSKQSMVIELTGSSYKIDGFMEMLNCYEIIEVCRTGITGISKSSKAWNDDLDVRPLIKE